MLDKELGRIFTFYSFKGGVGRTMAVANLAFVAASNGKRVLVMDWDLEAPGLAYYFRGLTEPSVTRYLKEAPGMLNILWRWRNAVDAEPNDIENNIDLNTFKSGDVFNNTVHPIVSRRFLGEEGCVDYIGAGSPLVETPTKVPYQEALSRFNWADFYESSGGGYFVDSLRKWAKSRYDLILIDSRTGFADVAGVCTMQLPDVVALCFVLNRQNIDGTATVAGAVHQSRGSDVQLRAVPMRTGRLDSPEQSDAMARAIRALKRTGKFGDEEVEKDVKELAILAADSVPYYETLAPFAARNRSSLDPLTLNYVEVASTLFETSLNAPALSAELIESVQTMLEPKNATVDYVKGLLTAEPARAISQLGKLLQGAHQSLGDAEPPSIAYVEAMVELASNVESEVEDIEEWTELQRQLLDLLRQLYRDSPKEWGALRLSTLETNLSSMSFIIEDGEELALLEEIDALLADHQPTHLTKRLRYLRRICRINQRAEKSEALSSSVLRLRDLIEMVNPNRSSLNAQEVEAVLAAELDASLLEAHLLERSHPERLTEKYLHALKLIECQRPDLINDDLRHLSGELFLRIFKHQAEKSGLPNPVHCAIEAARLSSGWIGFHSEFPALAHRVAKDGSTENVQTFLRAAVHSEEGSSANRASGAYVARNAVSATKHIIGLSSLLQRLLPTGNSPPKKTLVAIEQTLTSIFNTMIRRKRFSVKQTYDTVVIGAVELAGLLSDFGHPWKNAETLIDKLRAPPAS